MKFSVITFNEVYESSRSESRPPLAHTFLPNTGEALTQKDDFKELAWNYSTRGEDVLPTDNQKDKVDKIHPCVPKAGFLMSMVRIKEATLQIKIYEDTNYIEERKTMSLALTK
jgi:hypothetical protein